MKQEVWNNPVFQEYAKESLVLLELDFPPARKTKLSPEQTAHNEAMAEYNPKGSFLPPFPFTEGKEIAHFGYNPDLSAQDYVEYLKAQVTQ